MKLWNPETQQVHRFDPGPRARLERLVPPEGDALVTSDRTEGSFEPIPVK